MHAESIRRRRESEVKRISGSFRHSPHAPMKATQQCGTREGEFASGSSTGTPISADPCTRRFDRLMVRVILRKSRQSRKSRTLGALMKEDAGGVPSAVVNRNSDGDF